MISVSGLLAGRVAPGRPRGPPGEEARLMRLIILIRARCLLRGPPRTDRNDTSLCVTLYFSVTLLGVLYEIFLYLD